MAAITIPSGVTRFIQEQSQNVDTREWSYIFRFDKSELTSGDISSYSSRVAGLPGTPVGATHRTFVNPTTLILHTNASKIPALSEANGFEFSLQDSDFPPLVSNKSEITIVDNATKILRDTDASGTAPGSQTEAATPVGQVAQNGREYRLRMVCTPTLQDWQDESESNNWWTLIDSFVSLGSGGGPFKVFIRQADGGGPTDSTWAYRFSGDFQGGTSYTHFREYDVPSSLVPFVNGAESTIEIIWKPNWVGEYTLKIDGVLVAHAQNVPLLSLSGEDIVRFGIKLGIYLGASNSRTDDPWLLNVSELSLAY